MARSWIDRVPAAERAVGERDEVVAEGALETEPIVRRAEVVGAEAGRGDSDGVVTGATASPINAVCGRFRTERTCPADDRSTMGAGSLRSVGAAEGGGAEGGGDEGKSAEGGGDAG